MAVDGNMLRLYRIQKGLTMEEAAKELGIHGIVYTDIEDLRKEFNKYMK